MVKRVNIYLLCNVVFYSRSCVLSAPLAIEKYLRGKGCREDAAPTIVSENTII